MHQFLHYTVNEGMFGVNFFVDDISTKLNASIFFKMHITFIILLDAWVKMITMDTELAICYRGSACPSAYCNMATHGYRACCASLSDLTGGLLCLHTLGYCQNVFTDFESNEN